MAKAKKEIVGLVFGRLTIIEDLGTRLYSTTKIRFVLCRCQCGNTKEIVFYSVKKGLTKSCGCIQKEATTKHGMYDQPLYKIWGAIKARCNNPKHESYLHYGGRGIKMCEEWVADFNTFKKWAMSNGWKRGLQIDRKDNYKGYSPDNCRIVTRKINCNNTRKNILIEYNGESKTLSEWADALRINYYTLRNRLFRHENYINEVEKAKKLSQTA